MSNASEPVFSKLDEQKDAKQYVGPCPSCGRTLKLPQALFTDVFTDEIQCPAPPGCGNRLKVRLNEDVDAYCLYDLGPAARWEQIRSLPIDWDRLAAIENVDRLFELSARRDKWEAFLEQIERYQNELDHAIERAEAMRHSLEARLTAFETVFTDGHVDTVLAKARQQVENTSDELSRVANSSGVAAERIGKKFADLSATTTKQLEKFAEELSVFRKSLKRDVDKAFLFSNEKFRSISESFVTCDNNAKVVANRLRSLDATAEAVAARLGIAQANADEVAAQFASHLRRLIFDRQTIAHIVREVTTGTYQECDAARQDVVEKLPILVDYLECELLQWQAKPADDETRQVVVNLLNNLLRAIHLWLGARGIVRFGAPNDKYDYALHDIFESCESPLPDRWGRVKEVAYSGYRLRSTQTLLRRARVVIWEKPVEQTVEGTDETHAPPPDKSSPTS